jgi:hypothetical protein
MAFGPIMGAQSMAHDPLSHVASWLTPASADVADRPSPTSAAGDDPALVLIAEMKRLGAAMDAVNERAVASFATLPEDVRNGHVQVSFSRPWAPVLDRGYINEAHLYRWVATVRRVIVRHYQATEMSDSSRCEEGEKFWKAYLEGEEAKRQYFAGAEATAEVAAEVAKFDREIGLDQALTQLRAGLAEMAAVREASGYMAIERESDELDYQADAAFDQLKHTKPTTIAGVIAMLDIGAKEYGRELIEPTVAGLREITAGPRLTAADREELAEMLAEMGYDRATRTWPADRDRTKAPSCASQEKPDVIGFGELDPTV